MTRALVFTQDDWRICHCTEDQLQQELVGCLDLVKIILDLASMKDFRVRVGMRASRHSIIQTTNGTAPKRLKCAESLGVQFSIGSRRSQLFMDRDRLRSVKDVIGRGAAGTVQVRLPVPHASTSAHRRRQPAAPAGHHPPRGRRQHGAFHRRADRATSPRVPAVARAGAGPRS